MKRAIKAVAGGLAAAVLISAATRAAPLVLGEESMSQMRTSYRLSEPGPTANAPGIQGDDTASLAMSLMAPGLLTPGSSASPVLMAGPFQSTARPDGGVHRVARNPAHCIPTASAVARVALCRVGVPTRTLSDGEADQVTAAGFLFPVAAAMHARTMIGSRSMAFSPVARSSTFMRDVVVVPRPSPSMIVDIGRF